MDEVISRQERITTNAVLLLLVAQIASDQLHLCPSCAHATTVYPMASDGPPQSSLPPSMGPGARPVQPGESNLLNQVLEARSHYRINVENDAIRLGYQINGQDRNYRVPFDNMPLSGWMKRLNYGGQNSARLSGIFLLDMMRGSENVAGRKLTQEEVEGLASASSRRMTTQFLGQMSAVAAGAGFAWYGRKVMKFPFIKPKPLERYDVFPGRFLPLLKGGFARATWQITRFNTYIALWVLVSGPLFASVSNVSMTARLYNDPRTRDLSKTLGEKSKAAADLNRLEMNRARPGTAVQTASPQPQTPMTGEDGSPQVSFEDGYTGINTGSDPAEFTSESTFTDSATGSGLLDDSSMQQDEGQQRTPNAWSRAQTRAAGREEAQQQSSSISSRPSSSSSDFFFDDASPTAGNGPNMNAPTSNTRQNQTSGSGGVWDRLRSGNSSRPSPSQLPSAQSTSFDSTDSANDRRRDFESKQDSFSFSNSQEDRQLAKEQAQRDFDAMLERERREGGAGEYAQGMQATDTGSTSSSTSGSAWERRRRN